ncbi:hypothetical protein HQO44_16445 [Rhodococcus fascians]|nr:hypothetical protein [Rhodococcus fascians]
MNQPSTDSTGRAFAAARTFYEWPHSLDGRAAGEVLRAEPLAGNDLIVHAAVGHRLLYVSTGFDGTRVAVSGLVYLPRSFAPSQGWPLVSYAHGTTGITSAAAPSLNPRALLLGHPELGTPSALLEAGYAVACTDYQGLGTAGPHPYLHGPTLAHNQIDIVRASRDHLTELGASWVAIGHSEGGLASLFTAGRATELAPELDFRGAVATAPPTEWNTLLRHTSALGRILTPLVLHAATYHDSALKSESWLNQDGLTLRHAWESSFLLEPGTVLETFLPLMGRPLLTLSEDEIDDSSAAGRLANRMDTTHFEVPRNRLDRPAMIVEGGLDEFCVVGTVQRLAESLNEAGSDIEFLHLPGSGHLTLAEDAMADILAFVRRLLPGVSSAT